MINNVVLVSGVEQSDSVIHIHVPILFQILFPFRLLQNIEQSSLCHTVGPCWLSILNIVVWICMETQKTPNSQSNLENETWSWRNQAPWLQTIPQSYSNQDSMVLAQKQKYRSMEQNREHRNKSTLTRSINLGQKGQKYTMGKRQSLQ